MSQNTDIRLTVEAWAGIVIQNWEAKMLKLGINDTYALISSFEHTVSTEASGDVSRIEFAFNYYGKFLDMGVGRGQPLGTDGARSPRPWYSRTFYSELKKLTEILGEKYARKGQMAVIEKIKTAK